MSGRDVVKLAVLRVGRVADVEDRVVPYRLLDADGREVEPVTDYLREMAGRGSRATTLRSYAYDLLRWFRFLWAVEVAWDRAQRVDARDFLLWVSNAPKPRRSRRVQRATPPPGSVNRITGKPYPGATLSLASHNHNETVARAFYDYHATMGRGPVINPFPVSNRRPHAHHNPMQPWPRQRTGLYRRRQPQTIPRAIPDGLFNDLFAKMDSDRDRALLAMFVSAGPRAEELLGLVRDRVNVGDQLIGVIRKGSRALQWLPASPDSFVWLRCYQHQMRGVVPAGRNDPVWWTLRRPFRPLTYHACLAVLRRANALLGTNWSLHDLRHTACSRMAQDPDMPLTDVQWVMGHARISTTQRYMIPGQDEVIARARAHFARRNEPVPPPPPTPGYRPEVLDALLGRRLP
ncbi:tyrosine-type recombinase/integrase [Dactylosporangium sp. NPDC051485]|uniref:tyrosine-type recombinase/integrase n=1 Tax=Dactylosporangium sp. NPDC051485 TaxID=3154846 RepID=UPI003428F39F